jgi:glycerol kinase
MKQKKYVCAIDQGTTSTRFLVFNKNGKPVGGHQIEHKQIYPFPGFVEHNPVEIWENTCKVINYTLKKYDINPSEIAAIGITNQRETTVLWDRKTGKPVSNAIVWQDLRTSKICEELVKNGGKFRFQKITGLPVATYFSATKLKWLFDKNKKLKQKAKTGEILFGTIDSWLIWNLTGGVNNGVHITDVTNASRTLLMNLKTLNWDKNMLDIFEIPEEILPHIKPSIEPESYGYTKKSGPFNCEIPIMAALGDQQAALFGQVCFKKGEAKNTYGTGCFLLLNTGEKPVFSKNGLITTVAYKIGKSNAVYALEGSIAIAGSLVQWARDKLKIISSAPEINELAEKVSDNAGVYFVPAFSGLFAPYWRSDARGLIIGLTHFTGKEHIARAILEATAYQTKEIFNAMEKDSKIKLSVLKVDGGMTKSEILMQFQADILNINVLRPQITETTVLGAAYGAGLASSFFKNLDELKQNWTLSKKWIPNMSEKKRIFYYKNWKKAVQKSLNWIENAK